MQSWYAFLRKAIDCFDYYSFDPKNKVAEVVAYGEVQRFVVSAALIN